MPERARQVPGDVMKLKVTEFALPIIVAVAGVIAIGLWVRTGQRDLRERVAGLDYIKNRPSDDAADLEPPEPGEPVAGDGIAVDIPGDWPGFRGPGRDGFTTEEVPLATSWPADGPPVLWSREGLAEGYAGVSVSRGRVTILFSDGRNTQQ